MKFSVDAHAANLFVMLSQFSYSRAEELSQVSSRQFIWSKVIH
ncbi:hypothetical protein [Agarivorans aestuarii]|nr:hypothetical protein [Agarivorans aestuarii]